VVVTSVTGSPPPGRPAQHPRDAGPPTRRPPRA
jgi:hypothetical protein